VLKHSRRVRAIGLGSGVITISMVVDSSVSEPRKWINQSSLIERVRLPTPARFLNWCVLRS
jgi:hypothetical protein